jgi:nicotinate-nucleotide adenylyltransferase
LRSKVGILGGTFNPVHLGHLIVAQSALETFELSTMLLVPCAKPPHKAVPSLASAADRLAMVELAIEGDPRLAASDLEVRRGGVSYAVDTLTALRAADPDHDFFFVIGADTLTELHSWRRIDELLQLCEFVTFGRPGFDLSSLRPKDLCLPPPWPERLLARATSGIHIDISSSVIRHRVAEGMSIRYLVPPAVEMYIAEHGLYRG